MSFRYNVSVMILLSHLKLTIKPHKLHVIFKLSKTHNQKVIHITCNMGTRDLSDMYAQNRGPQYMLLVMCSRDLPDMYALSPRALGIHIRQIPCAHVTTITCISYNTGKSALPDIYARCPRVHIYQAKHECLCYN